ncbi:hypothetical protein JIN84_00340 [Luteolibacter yonseiensis]|uniref:Uncharacterized protein n=1 Tax=Luteolibacter yonseiensis TaxID=1144680 RepID=A0A934V9D4_9BACT|nr:hypothetical protein [Luteolibacter yonseiensis]MBK1814055.1 hypothetical protein [Luteolibacter yonseiensis]
MNLRDFKSKSIRITFMKIRKSLVMLSSVALLVGVIAWSPPNSEDVVVGTSSMTSPTGALLIVGSGSSGKAKGSLIVGRDHMISEGSGQGERLGTIVSGTENTVDATSSLVSGSNNQVLSATSTEPRNVGVIGANNLIGTVHGYAIGYTNVVSGDYGVALGASNTVASGHGRALGSGLSVTQDNSVALGIWNAPMVTGDLLVVGNGSSTARSTAMTVKKDGSVLLGKAQGDISMGIYTGE